MPLYNRDAGYGAASFRAQHDIGRTTGRTFMVADGTTPEANYNLLSDLWKPDPDGNVRLFGSITAALAACTAGRGDRILLSPGFATAPTLTELATCATKGVMMEQAGGRLGDAFVTQRATAVIPQTGASTLFTVTAPVRILDIIGEVTTTVQTQANSVQLQAFPTVGSSVSLCADLNITAFATGTILGITGTLANAMTSNANGVLVSQAAPVTVPAGTVKLVSTASNTGNIKWMVRYQPIIPGARVFSA